MEHVVAPKSIFKVEIIVCNQKDSLPYNQQDFIHANQSFQQKQNK